MTCVSCHKYKEETIWVQEQFPGDTTVGLHGAVCRLVNDMFLKSCTV